MTHQPNWNLKARIYEVAGSQVAFSKKIGLHESIISNIVNGWRIPKPHEAEAIATGLGVTVKEIFG